MFQKSGNLAMYSFGYDHCFIMNFAAKIFYVNFNDFLVFISPDPM